MAVNEVKRTVLRITVEHPPELEASLLFKDAWATPHLDYDEGLTHTVYKARIVDVVRYSIDQEPE